jgi:Putative Ig domain
MLLPHLFPSNVALEVHSVRTTRKRMLSAFRCGALAIGLLSLAQVTIAQSVTYPAPPSGPTGTIGTVVVNPITVTGCQDTSLNGSSTSTFATIEAIWGPFWGFTGSFPNNGSGPIVRITYPFTVNQVLTLVNGVSQGQGSSAGTATSGTYPATVGSGVGEKGTYTFSVSGGVVTEHYVVNAQFQTSIINQNYFYTFDSSYDIQSGIQTYSVSFNLNDTRSNNPLLPGCTTTNIVTESGSGTYNYRNTSLQITTTQFATGTLGMAYSQQITASGGTPPYSWSAVGLASGLSINSASGLISGTPTQAGTFPVTVTVSDSTGLNASQPFSLVVNGTCPAANVALSAGGQLSQDGRPTTMIALFTPKNADGTATSLALAAAGCGFMEFDWQQTIDTLPTVSCSLTPELCPVNSPPSSLTAPPAIPDPPAGGWNYFFNANGTFNQLYDNYYQAYPFYYNPSIVPTGCALLSTSGGCATPITSPDDTTLAYSDVPCDPLLVGNQYVGFTTRLVGVNEDGTVGPALFRWSWLSTYNCFTGTVQYSSSVPVNGLGTGGVTITSINNVVQTPPSLTCSVTQTRSGRRTGSR